jgi:uncharacterized protein (TIRG00374 family)
VKRRARVFELIVLALGVVGLAFALRELGWDGMRQAIVDTGWWFVVIAAIDLASLGCDAFGVHGFLRPKANVSYPRVLGAQASGLAINRLTPGNSLGEPVKVTMLARYVPTDVAVAAIVMFNLTTYYVAITAVVVGVPITVLLLDLPSRVQVAVLIAIAVLVVAAVAIALVVRRGAIGTIIDAAVAVRVLSRKRAEKWRARIAAIDLQLRHIGNAETSGIRRGLAGVVGSRVLNMIGTIVVLHAVAIPLSAPLVVATLSVGIVVQWMSNIVPLGLGVADGANYILYDLLGATHAAGLLFTMVNRLRTVVLAFLGLAIMGIANAAFRSGAQHQGVAGAAPVQGGEPP